MKTVRNTVINGTM